MRANRLVFRGEARKDTFLPAPVPESARVRIGKKSAWRHVCIDGVTIFINGGLA